ncbi:MAG: ankyrin repeat domain-containing protein [Synergistaceae bacterium]|nr:ankyrin repeat domain-containing protein [Synergistaceae bacterium]
MVTNKIRKYLPVIFTLAFFVYTVSTEGAVEPSQFTKLCATGTPQEIEAAIKAGADVNAKEYFNRTALMYAAEFNANPEVIVVLIKAGADVNAKNNDGGTVLMHAAQFNANPEVIAVLIKAGADIHSADDLGMTALMRSTMNTNPEVLRILVENGGNVNIANNDGWTSLMAVVEDNLDFEFIKILIDKGADVNATDLTGMTSLMWASRNSNPKILQFLIDNGANVNAADNRKMTPLMWAIAPNAPGVLAMLKEKGMEGKPLEVFPADNYKVVQMLIESGADINAANAAGSTPLMWAAGYNSNLDILHALIERGADVNVANESKITVLMSAAAFNTNPVVQLLIEKGANVNASDEDGRTPLMYAARFNLKPEVLITLLENGADANASDLQGKRAIDYEEQNKDSQLKGTRAYDLLRTKTESSQAKGAPEVHYLSAAEMFEFVNKYSAEYPLERAKRELGEPKPEPTVLDEKRGFGLAHWYIAKNELSISMLYNQNTNAVMLLSAAEFYPNSDLRDRRFDQMAAGIEKIGNMHPTSKTEQEITWNLKNGKLLSIKKERYPISWGLLYSLENP